MRLYSNPVVINGRSNLTEKGNTGSILFSEDHVQLNKRTILICKQNKYLLMTGVVPVCFR